MLNDEIISVLFQKTGACPLMANLSMTLFQAFDRLGLACPDLKLINHLDGESSIKAVQQEILLLGVAVNRLRKSDGAGHGRPYLPTVTEEEARLATQALGIVSEFVLGKLKT